MIAGDVRLQRRVERRLDPRRRAGRACGEHHLDEVRRDERRDVAGVNVSRSARASLQPARPSARRAASIRRSTTRWRDVAAVAIAVRD